MIYTVTFAPALDYAVWLESVRPGEVNRSLRARLYVGGKGINVAAALGGLGVQSVCLGFAAGFTGREIVRRLRQAGISEQLIMLRDGVSRINIKLKAGEETEINAAGPAADDGAMSAFYAQLDRLEPGDVLALGGSPPPGADGALYGRLVAMARAKGAEAVVDATGDQLVHALAQGPLLVKPNLAELEEVAGAPIRTSERLAAQARALTRMGAKNVMVSLGGRGALLASGQGVYHCAAPAGAVQNTTGAGDTMVAAYLYAHGKGMPDAQRLRLCVAAGSASAFSEELATRELIWALFQQTPQPVRLGD